MKFVLKPSLEHMTLVQIAIFLWNQNDVRILIIKHSSENLYSRKNWKTIEERVIENVLLLSLPQLLKEKMVGLIRPIGLEILKWIDYHDSYNSWKKFRHNCQGLPAKFCWTIQGTIDWKKTAEVIIKNEYLNVVPCYILACDACLEDDIIRFWRDLPENVKYGDWEQFSVLSFWCDNMKRGETDHISYKDIFQNSAFKGNKVAAKYFFQKLTPQQRWHSLIIITVFSTDGTEVLRFLFSEMEEEEQIEALRRKDYSMLRRFLEWPWQSFFIEVANCSWNFVSKNIFDKLLRDIIGKIKDGYKDYNYQKLFREFWLKTPRPLKDSFLENIDHSLIIQSLFDIKDKENIRLILKDASFIEKKRLIYSDEINGYLTRFVWDNEWDFLEFIIRKCLPSKDEMLKFKEEFEKRSPYTKEHLEKNKDRWSEIFCFSNDSICKINKRSVEESESSSSKRFQSLQ